MGIDVNVAINMEEFSTQPDFFIKEDEFLGDVSGNMNIPSINRPANGEGVPEFNTLDEPIRQTIVRDLKAVGDKFIHVLYPRQTTNLLTEWDLWGPLILCTFMALLLQESYSAGNTSHDGGPEFAEVFVIVWVGAMVVTVNTKLLGGTISFFQSVCVLVGSMGCSKVSGRLLSTTPKNFSNVSNCSVL